MADIKLPLEKELTLATFEMAVDGMTTEQAKTHLKDLMKLHMVSEQQYLALLRKYMLGIDE